MGLGSKLLYSNSRLIDDLFGLLTRLFTENKIIEQQTDSERTSLEASTIGRNVLCRLRIDSTLSVKTSFFFEGKCFNHIFTL